MSAHVIRRFAGLLGSSNPYGSVPEGALELADNCILRNPDTLEPRRGYQSTSPGTVAVQALAFYKGALFGVGNGAGAYKLVNPWAPVAVVPGGNSALSYVGGPFFAYPPSDVARARFAQTNKALYWQGKYGLTKIESADKGATSGLIECRPAIRPPFIFSESSSHNYAGAWLAADAFGTSGTWLAKTFAVAYRVTVCRYGANGELIESEPSDRFIVTNATGAATGVVGTLYNSWLLPSDCFLRVYRSASVDPTKSDPSDELFLVQEVMPFLNLGTDGWTSLANGVSFTDVTPDSSLYVPLYTNPVTGNGIARANVGAPLSQDLFTFNGRLYFLNTTDKQRLTIRVIGTGTGGINVGDSITLNGFKFTFAAAASADYTRPLCQTSGTVAQNIEATARSLVGAINGYMRSLGTQNPAPIVVARYESLTSNDAGQIVLESLCPGANAITVQTSSRNGWASDYTAGTTSTTNRQAAGLAWSEFEEPEGVPTANNDIVGDPNQTLLRGLPLRDAALLFKSDGVWKLTDDGSQAGPQVQLYDSALKLIAPDTAVVLENNVVMLAEDGVWVVNETGKANISHGSIERELLKLIAFVGATTIASLAFAVARKADHEYILCLPESPNASNCTLQYVFNTQTQAWTRWTLPGVLAGVADPDTGKLYWSMGNAPAGVSAWSYAVWTERRSGDLRDYFDPTIALDCGASTATATLTFTGQPNIAIGDLLQQPQTTYYLSQRVTGVSYNSGTNVTTVTLDAAPATAWQAGSSNLNLCKAVQARPRFLPFHMGAPATVKAIDKGFAAFRYFDLPAFACDWASDMYQPDNAVEQSPITWGTWAPQPWGAGFWGQQTRDVLVMLSVPQDLQDACLLTLGFTFPCAGRRFELCAVDIKQQPETDEAVR